MNEFHDWVMILFTISTFGGTQVLSVVPMKDQATCNHYRHEIIWSNPEKLGDFVSCQDLAKDPLQFKRSK